MIPPTIVFLGGVFVGISFAFFFIFTVSGLATAYGKTSGKGSKQ